MGCGRLWMTTAMERLRLASDGCYHTLLVVAADRKYVNRLQALWNSLTPPVYLQCAAILLRVSGRNTRGAAEASASGDRQSVELPLSAASTAHFDNGCSRLIEKTLSFSDTLARFANFIITSPSLPV